MNTLVFWWVFFRSCVYFLLKKKLSRRVWLWHVFIYDIKYFFYSKSFCKIWTTLAIQVLNLSVNHKTFSAGYFRFTDIVLSFRINCINQSNWVLQTLLGQINNECRIRLVLLLFYLLVYGQLNEWIVLNIQIIFI